MFNSRSASDERLHDDQITTIFRTSTRATYGLVTSAGRLVLAHVVDLPALPASATLSLQGGVQADDLISMTESTDPVRGERVVTAIAMEQSADNGENGGGGQAAAVAGHRHPQRCGQALEPRSSYHHGFLAGHRREGRGRSGVRRRG